MSEGLETRAERIDWRVFTAINGLAGRWRALDVPMIAIAHYGPIATALPVVFLCFAGNGQQVSFHRKMALRAALNFAVARVAKDGINRLFPRPRPYEKHNVHLLVKPTEKPSFPSNHTAESWALALGVRDGPRPVVVTLVILAFLVGVARVFVGKHYPSDVAGGALLAVGVDSLLERVPALRTTSE